MKSVTRLFRSLLLLGLLCSWPTSVSATTIDPMLFEELVLGADFVGIVECEQAGGIVAKYVVVESWKGPKVGAKITIRVAVNYWEPQFPITLCGERFFVTAYKEAPSRVISTTSGGGVPLWWRNIDADYRLPLFQGRTHLTNGEEKSPDFEKTRKRAKELLGLKPAEQEAALLKAVIDKDFLGKKWRGGESDEIKAKALRDRLTKLTTAEALIDELLTLAKSDREKWAVRANIVLSKAGGTVALGRLQKIPADQSPWDKEDLEGLIDSIKERIGMAVAERPDRERLRDKKSPTTPEELAKLRTALASGPRSDDFGEALELLTQHDPGAVAEYLAKWTNPKKDWRDADIGYVLGSYFAWKCGADRSKHLKSLHNATDPYVRVAGAVYLCFEDAESATENLKKLTAVEGDPGVWAALTLVRRGHKEAVPRALEVFRELPKEQKDSQFGMAGVPHRNLQKHLLVVLSNAARTGGVPQPSLPEAEGKQFDYLTDWWKRHGAKAVTLDPWLKTLEKQKVD